jgi:hypothetical protein
MRDDVWELPEWKNWAVMAAILSMFLMTVFLFARVRMKPSPSKQQNLNATANAFGAPDVLRTCHFATIIVNSVLAS